MQQRQACTARARGECHAYRGVQDTAKRGAARSNQIPRIVRQRLAHRSSFRQRDARWRRGAPQLCARCPPPLAHCVSMHIAHTWRWWLSAGAGGVNSVPRQWSAVPAKPAGACAPHHRRPHPPLQGTGGKSALATNRWRELPAHACEAAQHLKTAATPNPPLCLQLLFLH